MIEFQCACGQAMTANEHDADKEMRCRNCNARVTIPTSAAFQSGAPPLPATAAVREGQPPVALRGHNDCHERPLQRDELASSGKAYTALILGLRSFCLPGLLSLPAIVFGILGLTDARKGKSGSGMAVAGMLMGIFSLLLLALLIPAVQWLRQEAAARAQSSGNMKQIVLAMHDYHDFHRKLPQHAIYSKNGKPLLSWRVAILPYIEQDALYRRFKLDEPWDSPNNLPLLKLMPRTYAHPLGDPSATKNGLTHYQVFVGEPGQQINPVFVREANFSTTLSEINARDGAHITILIVEAATPVPWTKPKDITYSPARPLPNLGVFRSGFNVGMVVGSVHFLSNRVNEQTLRNAITYNDGTALGPDFWR